jgi:hypothetical protein
LSKGTEEQATKKIAPGIALALVYCHFLDRKLADKFIHHLEKIVREGNFFQKSIIILGMLERLNEAASHGCLERGTYLAESITKLSEIEQIQKPKFKIA